MGGRPRKPTAVKKLQGTDRADRLTPYEPIPTTQLCKVKPPTKLSPEAQEIWEFAIAQCPPELLSTMDFALMAVWADTFAKILELEHGIQRDGLLVEKDDGTYKKNPALAIQNELKVIMRGYINDLGFSPASRSKISLAPKTEKKNGFIELDG